MRHRDEVRYDSFFLNRKNSKPKSRDNDDDDDNDNENALISLLNDVEYRTIALPLGSGSFIQSRFSKPTGAEERKRNHRDIGECMCV